MKDPVDRAVRAIARRNSYALVVLVVRSLGSSLRDLQRATERVRAAFGAYVDPGIADRVLREGSDLEGVELRGKRERVALWAPHEIRAGAPGRRSELPVAD